MPTPRQPHRPEKLQPHHAGADMPRSYRNSLLIPVADRIANLRTVAANMQAEGAAPFELLVETRKARLKLAKQISVTQATIEDQLDTQHKSRLSAYQIFLHGMVLTPSLMAYGPEDTDARAIRHVTASGIHPAVAALAAQAARRAVVAKRQDLRPAATREATLLALGTRMTDPDRLILPALTGKVSQKEQAEYFTFGNAGEVMHTFVHLDGSTRHNVGGAPGLAVVTRSELGLMADCHPWNSPASNQTSFALEDELNWQRAPVYSQNREFMCDNRTGLETVTQGVMHILNNHLVAYDPTA